MEKINTDTFIDETAYTLENFIHIYCDVVYKPMLILHSPGGGMTCSSRYNYDYRCLIIPSLCR